MMAILFERQVQVFALLCPRYDAQVAPLRVNVNVGGTNINPVATELIALEQVALMNSDPIAHLQARSQVAQQRRPKTCDSTERQIACCLLPLVLHVALPLPRRPANCRGH